MKDRAQRQRDYSNMTAWRRSRMGWLEAMLEAFLPSPASPAEINYYIRHYDTDGVPYRVKAQRRADRSPLTAWPLGRIDPPPSA